MTRFARLAWVIAVAAALVTGLFVAPQAPSARGSAPVLRQPGEITATEPMTIYLPLLTSSPVNSPTFVWTGTITIPTHPVEAALETHINGYFNIPYQRIDWTAYDGSVIENRAYTLVYLENDYLRVSLMPQLGGRVYQIVDKASGQPMLYQNAVIKPSHWGPLEVGWWLAAGGIEWCLPVEEHGYESAIPWAYTIDAVPGGMRVTLRDSDAANRLRARVAVTLYDREAAVHIAPRIENPTAAPLDFQYWTNAMLAPGGGNQPSAETRFVMSGTEATVHSTGDHDRLPGAGQPFAWPVYNGVDWSRLGNWDQWLGFFQRPEAAGGFQAVYDGARNAGVVRAYSSPEARGAKFFGFGWARPIDPSNYTDDGSSYVEMHGGATPQFGTVRTLAAGDSLTWDESWYPVVNLGGLTWANDTVALRVETSAGQTRASIVANRTLTSARIKLVRITDQIAVYDAQVPSLAQGQVLATGWVAGPIGVLVQEGDTVVAHWP
ncbi:MAG: DUF5107 domain-containing protein [Chloroflexi bacterium]|nr:DUF5107 domain-containing protein [Chloroflexota bacterium]